MKPTLVSAVVLAAAMGGAAAGASEPEADLMPSAPAIGSPQAIVGEVAGLNFSLRGFGEAAFRADIEHLRGSGRRRSGRTSSICRRM